MQASGDRHAHLGGFTHSHHLVAGQRHDGDVSGPLRPAERIQIASPADLGPTGQESENRKEQRKAGEAPEALLHQRLERERFLQRHLLNDAGCVAHGLLHHARRAGVTASQKVNRARESILQRRNVLFDPPGDLAQTQLGAKRLDDPIHRRADKPSQEYHADDDAQQRRQPEQPVERHDRQERDDPARHDGAAPIDHQTAAYALSQRG